jgi:hypothetical protein
MVVSRTLRIAICLFAACAAVLVAFHVVREPPETTAGAASIAPEPVLKPVPATPIAQQKAELGDDETWHPQWDAMIEKALPADLLSPSMQHKVQPFCPRFSRMSVPDRRAFWAYFFQALAGAEAGLNRTANVQHDEPQVAVEDGVTHRRVRSEGLLQLTYEDSDRYGCDFDWKHDRALPEHAPDKTILQPKNNLLCGVRILDRQLVVKKKPLLSTSSYWSVLRPGWPGSRVFDAQMENTPAACGRRRMAK